MVLAGPMRGGTVTTQREARNASIFSHDTPGSQCHAKCWTPKHVNALIVWGFVVVPTTSYPLSASLRVTHDPTAPAPRTRTFSFGFFVISTFLRCVGTKIVLAASHHTTFDCQISFRWTISHSISFSTSCYSQSAL